MGVNVGFRGSLDVGIRHEVDKAGVWLQGASSKSSVDLLSQQSDCGPSKSEVEALETHRVLLVGALGGRARSQILSNGDAPRLPLQPKRSLRLIPAALRSYNSLNRRSVNPLHNHAS